MLHKRTRLEQGHQRCVKALYKVCIFWPEGKAADTARRLTVNNGLLERLGDLQRGILGILERGTVGNGGIQEGIDTPGLDRSQQGCHIRHGQQWARPR